MSKIDAIKHSTELLAEEMQDRKEQVLSDHYNFGRRAVVDLGGLVGAGALVYFTDGLVWLALAALIGAISLWGLFWKVVGSL
jgi:hypothetical protein